MSKTKLVFTCVKCHRKCSEWRWFNDDSDDLDYEYLDLIFEMFDELRRTCTNYLNPVSFHEGYEIKEVKE